jgi:hypothetical protein
VRLVAIADKIARPELGAKLRRGVDQRGGEAGVLTWHAGMVEKRRTRRARLEDPETA